MKFSVLHENYLFNKQQYTFQARDCIFEGVTEREREGDHREKENFSEFQKTFSKSLIIISTLPL